ncbi:GDP-mannose 4,6-dehydratase [Candidatus Micrarchaeota archaeon]|nr:GDP-mannose 4,6-dehydratase [Candidatus Micrarchaeota archaeon]
MTNQETQLLSFEEVFDHERFKELKKSKYLIDIEALVEYRQEIDRNRSEKPNGAFWKDKRILITGTAGMVGSTIADILVEMGAEVYGTVKRHAVPHYPNINAQIADGRIKTHEVDLRDYGRVVELMKQIEPHAIFHQAAESFIPTSIKQPSHVVENNCVSTVNLLEAATRDDKSLEGIQLACSSEEYGFINNLEELPVKETHELRPTSTYAATKVFTEYLGRAYFYMYKTPTIMTRTFNQEGPRRGPQFFTARIANQISAVLEGKADKIVMGNPNSVRDFTHVHDSARAQIMAIERCNRGEAYNICSGKGIATGDYVKLALQTFELDKKIKVFIDKAFLRPYERGECLFDGFIGDNSKFVEKTNWKPTLSVVDIIKDGVASINGHCTK